MNLTRELIVKPGKKARLDDLDPDATPGFDSREEGLAALEQNKAPRLLRSDQCSRGFNDLREFEGSEGRS